MLNIPKTILVIFIIKNIEAVTKNIDSNSTNKLLLAFKNDPHALFLSANTDHFVKFLAPETNVTSTTANNENGSTTLSTEEISTFTDSSTIDYGSTTVASFENVTEGSFGNESTSKKKFDHDVMAIRKSGESCSCDLILTSCDINCCCDPQCGAVQRAVFTRCDDDVPIAQLNGGHHCRSKVFYYKNNTRFKQFINSDSLFCIAKDNLPPTKDDEYKIITTLKDMERIHARSHSWNKEIDGEIKRSKGRPVLMCLEGVISELTVPSFVFHTHCEKRDSVQHFENVKTKCLSKISDLEMFEIYSQYNSNGSFIQNNTFDKQNCSSKDNCLKYEILTCGLQNCQPLNLTKHPPTCNDNICINIATKIQYIFYTNATHLKSAKIKLFLEKISPKKYHIWQDIEVQFLFGNDSEDYYAISGNPGYLSGKPVISMKQITLENGSKAEDIKLKNGYPLRNVLPYPVNINGDCVLNNVTHGLLNFGENFQSRCTATYNLTIEKKNATLICNEIQKKLYEYFAIVPNSDIFLSSYGNPFFSNVRVPLIYDLGEDVEGLEGGDGILCFNLVTDVLYEFSYVTTPDGYNRIMGALLHLNPQRQPHDCAVHLLTLHTSAVWHRLPTPARYLDPTPPKLHISLPNDFFYPFTYSQAGRIIWSKFVLFFCCVFLSAVGFVD